MDLPSGQRYWTVIDDDLRVVPVADQWLRFLRLGRGRAELTTKSHASGVAFYFRWCLATGRNWTEAAQDLGLFIRTAACTTGSRPAPAAGAGSGPQSRNTRLAARAQQLEKRLSQLMGEHAWRESGLGAPADIEELQRTLTRPAS